MKDDTQVALKLFIKKAQKLRSTSFIKYFLDVGKLSLSLISPEHMEPDDEARDAFLLTFRLFFFDGDGFSFRYLDEKISRDSSLSEHWKQEVKDVREWLMQYLGGPSLLVVDGTSFTRQNVLDVFLYGDLAHVNTKKNKRVFNKTLRQQYEMWEQEEAVFRMYHLELNQILFDIFNAIVHISNLNEQELKQFS